MERKTERERERVNKQTDEHKGGLAVPTSTYLERKVPKRGKEEAPQQQRRQRRGGD